MYVYKYIDDKLYVVGFYDPSGRWVPESDWLTQDGAIERVNFLNGGGIGSNAEEILKDISFAIQAIANTCGN